MLILLVWFAIALSAAYAAMKWRHGYWKRKGFVSHPNPEIFFGHLGNPLTNKRHIADLLRDIYRETKKAGNDFVGVYFGLKPAFMPINLDYVKNIMLKDFNHFVDRGVYYNEKDDPLSAHLFAIGGTKWKNLRAKLSPTFTSGKMRLMFDILVECGTGLDQQMNKLYKKKEPLDIKEILGCFTTNVIGSCAFGLDCKTFEDDNSPFRVYGRRVFEASGLRRLILNIAFNFHSFGRALHLTLNEPDVADFFLNMVKNTVKHRKQNNISRNDFLQMLMNLETEETSAHDGTSLSFEEIAAQCFVFFIAGFETSSTTMTFALHELSRHPEIQDKVREEVREVLAKHDNKITYDAINEMKYMQQVLEETLRMYPPLPLLTRGCVKDYQLPGTNLVIEKGSRIAIPVWAIHYDAEHFPEPTKFDPDRFTEENKKTRHQFAHIPFGEGPRLCIGMRFGVMQSKVGLAVLLRKYKFTLNAKTETPLKYNPNSFVLTTKSGIWLNAEQI